MKIKAVFQGRPYVWWLTHRHEARLAVLCCVFGSVLFALHETRLMAVVEEKNLLQAALADERASKKLPGTVFILEGSTIEQAQVKLARVAGDLDVARHAMGRGK